MSATVFNIFDLETEWKNAPDGFSDGYDFKTWLASKVIALRAQAAQAEALEQAVNEARELIEKYSDLPLGKAGYCSYPMLEHHQMAYAWLAAHAPAPEQEQAG